HRGDGGGGGDSGVPRRDAGTNPRGTQLNRRCSEETNNAKLTVPRFLQRSHAMLLFRRSVKRGILNPTKPN
ncbi:MAG: hypothetical protein ACXADB_14720, partial [Candidatus Hermodarchaeia archaeon]